MADKNIEVRLDPSECLYVEYKRVRVLDDTGQKVVREGPQQVAGGSYPMGSRSQPHYQMYRTLQPLKRVTDVYECKYYDCTRKWTVGQCLCLVCGFTGAGLFLLSSVLSPLIGFLSAEGVDRLGAVLMTAGFGLLTPARSGLELDKFDRRAWKRTGEEMFAGKWEDDGPSYEVPVGSPSPL